MLETRVGQQHFLPQAFLASSLSIPMSDIAIKAEGLSKRYRIGHRGTHADDLRHRLANAASAPFKKLFGRNGKTSPLATRH